MRVGNGIDRFLIGGFKSIGGIDFCEVTKEDVLERQTCWKWNRLVSNCNSESIGIIDFCEVTKEGVLGSKAIEL
jgi:hypothetical protein